MLKALRIDIHAFPSSSVMPPGRGRFVCVQGEKKRLVKYFSVEQLAENLVVDRQTIVKLIKLNGLETVKVGRLVRVPEGEVDKLVNPNRQDGGN